MRGNHESKNMNRIYGFEGEVKAKVRRPDAQDSHHAFSDYVPLYALSKAYPHKLPNCLLMPFLFPVDPLAPRSTTTW